MKILSSIHHTSIISLLYYLKVSEENTEMFREGVPSLNGKNVKENTSAMNKAGKKHCQMAEGTENSGIEIDSCNKPVSPAQWTPRRKQEPVPSL